MVSGLAADLENLLKAFIKTNSLRFEHFSKCWRELNFSKITSNRLTYNDHQVLVENINLHCLNYLQDRFSEPIRVGALYI